MSMQSDTPVQSDTPELQDMISTARVLVVDDVPIMRKMIVRILERAGFQNIHQADDGDIALQMIAKKLPDIVILDLNMPRMSGYDVCRELRKNPDTAKLPVLVQSASETPEERVEVFEVGATDFVSKPINAPELVARVNMHLENRMLIQSLNSFHQRLEGDLVQAHDMQLALLPTPDQIAACEKRFDIELQATYQASAELGGDLWFLSELNAHQLALGVIDVAGHGVASAMNTFRIHATMRRLAAVQDQPAKFMEALNRELAPDMPPGQFATVFYGLLDLDKGKLVYSGAAAPTPFILRDDAVESLDTIGYPIGVSSKTSYREHAVDLGPGDSLFLYSDVLIETPMEDDEILGSAGLENWMQGYQKAAKPRREVHDDILKRLFAALDGAGLPDDLTLISCSLKN